MSKKKITLELTEQELLDIKDVMTDMEAIMGCAEPIDDGDPEPDVIRSKQIKRFKRMLRRNGIKIV